MEIKPSMEDWSSRSRILLICLFLGLATGGWAQKHDYIWVNGYDDDNGPEYRHFTLNFHSSPVAIDTIDFGEAKMTEQVTSFCDAEGNLVLASNGCYLFDLAGQILPGGDTLNPGEIYDTWCVDYCCYPMPFGAIMLPIDSNRVFMYHHGAKYDWKFTLTRKPTYATIISYSDGGVHVDTVNSIIADFHAESPAACQHGNGRDWWVISPEKGTSLYHRTWISGNEGITTTVQDIGFAYPFPDCEATGFSIIFN